jgi:DNA-directed RNA polymerase specialized sigma24 family protein
LKALTEAELLKAINYVVDSLAGGFTFGSYTIEDIQQEARCFALEALRKFNPNFKQSGTLEEKLRSFLFTTIRRRLMNLKRDKQGKTKAKHKLVYALPIDEINDIDESNMSLEDNLDSLAEINHFREKILYELDEIYREDYHKLLAGVSLPKANKERLMLELRRIVCQGD